MTDTPPISPQVPEQPPVSQAVETRDSMLRTLAARSAPISPPGAAAALTDRILVHTSWDTASVLLPNLPKHGSGLVLRGAKRLTGCKQLRKAEHDGVILVDPEGYTVAAATEEDPFVLGDPRQDALFIPTLEEILQAQRSAGATVAMTPTGYLYAGDGPALKSAANTVAALGRDDVLFSVPLDIAWLTNDHIGLLIAVLSRLDMPKAIFLGAQFDPLKRYKPAALNLRRLVAEAGHVAVLKTDLTALDVLCHGAFAASIGTGGSLRHIVPVGQFPHSGKRDPSPSVLFGELMAYFKGSTLAERFANDPPPICLCASCGGRALDTFRSKDDTEAAHLHGILTWSEWAIVLRGRPTLADRAAWWQRCCQAAVQQHDVLNAALGQDEAFTPPTALEAWATLPAWLPTTQATPAAPTSPPRRSPTR